MSQNQKLEQKEQKIDYAHMDKVSIALAQAKAAKAKEENQKEQNKIASQIESKKLPIITESVLDNEKGRLIVYLPKDLIKAIKVRAAISDKPEDKDYSAIARTAFELYLTE